MEMEDTRPLIGLDWIDILIPRADYLQITVAANRKANKCAARRGAEAMRRLQAFVLYRWLTGRGQMIIRDDRSLWQRHMSGRSTRTRAVEEKRAERASGREREEKQMALAHRLRILYWYIVCFELMGLNRIRVLPHVSRRGEERVKARQRQRLRLRLRQRPLPRRCATSSRTP